MEATLFFFSFFFLYPKEPFSVYQHNAASRQVQNSSWMFVALLCLSASGQSHFLFLLFSALASGLIRGVKVWTLQPYRVLVQVCEISPPPPPNHGFMVSSGSTTLTSFYESQCHNVCLSAISPNSRLLQEVSSDPGICWVGRCSWTCLTLVWHCTVACWFVFFTPFCLSSYLLNVSCFFWFFFVFIILFC